jgi:predicted nucleic acid-binding protein
MMTSRSLYTVDTNVLIDLHRGNVLEKFFKLPYQFVSPDVILEDELLEPSGASLIRLGLQRCELSGEEVLAVEKLYEHHSNIAVGDLFTLMLALGRGLTLLTGDNNLVRSFPHLPATGTRTPAAIPALRRTRRRCDVCRRDG